MRAAVLTSSGLSYLENYSPQPLPNAVEVNVLQAGICETDLQLMQGYMGFQGVPGHEFVGIAESGEFAGQRVVGEINCSCGSCSYCEAGMSTHCPHRSVVGILNHDGAFAQNVWIPEKNLHAIPDNVTNDAAVFVEPLAAAFQIPAQLDLQKFESVVVLGDGRLGNLCAQVLQLHSLSPLVVGKHPEKLDRLSKLGLNTALLSDVNEQHFADLVVDCTGSAIGLTTACQFIKPRGTIVLKTTVANPHGPNLAPVVIDEVTIVGSRCGPFPAAIEALANQRVQVEELITNRFALSQVVAAFEVAKQKDQLKVILDVSQ